jgi:hypothetical protein
MRFGTIVGSSDTASLAAQVSIPNSTAPGNEPEVGYVKNGGLCANYMNFAKNRSHLTIWLRSEKIVGCEFEFACAWQPSTRRDLS